jgi:uncharacterized protein (TIGR01370 family)
VFGGVDAARIRGYELAVVDGVREADGASDISAEQVSALQQGGTLVVSYLSVGTVESWRAYATEVSASWTIGPVENWPEERYVDVRESGWQKIMVREARSLAASGFDGLYLDNLDIAEEFPETREAVIELVTKLRAAVPDVLLVAQNGLSVAERLPIDAIAHEDTYWRWDSGGYRASTPRETSTILRGLRRLRDRGLPVFTLDYTEPGSTAALDVIARSLAEGFRPAVSVLDLNRPPHAVPQQ